MTSMKENDESRSVGERIAEVVADVTDTDPMDLEPVYDRVDTTSLDRLFEATSRTPRDRGHVAFPMAGCQIVVYADGTIVVDSDDERRAVSLPDARDQRPLSASEFFD
jgi:hypothetical protein